MEVGIATRNQSFNQTNQDRRICKKLPKVHRIVYQNSFRCLASDIWIQSTNTLSIYVLYKCRISVHILSHFHLKLLSLYSATHCAAQQLYKSNQSCLAFEYVDRRSNRLFQRPSRAVWTYINLRRLIYCNHSHLQEIQKFATRKKVYK